MSYSNELHVLYLVSLLKKHNIRKIIISPGATNVPFVLGVQSDPFFEIYSSVDERSAAYMACGLSEESGEPVVLSCTGATASRNYMPGLTEAYYRKLPILAITSSQPIERIGHMSAQLIDRTIIPNDIAKISVNLDIIKNDNDIWSTEIKINTAILELKRNGGGPAHINLVTGAEHVTLENLPDSRYIKRISYTDTFPELPKGKIGIFVGAHNKWTDEEVKVIDGFCSSNNAVVFCDHTSNYKGKYRVLYSLVGAQTHYKSEVFDLDLLIHIGEISGDYYTLGPISKAKIVWRVSEDGEIRDFFKKLEYVFQIQEKDFFKSYIQTNISKNTFLEECRVELENLRSLITDDIPFSNIWTANILSKELPINSVLHLGILNTLRSWNFFEIPNEVLSYSNVGGFGIDGNMSSLIGASLVEKEKLYFGIVGDLSFFYDLNSVGNRYIGSNIRIMLINNGRGTEFTNYCHVGGYLGYEKTDRYIAAAGHFGNKSKSLVKNYVENLGFEYISASNKKEFLSVYKKFIDKNICDKPIVFEVFTDSKDESDALKIIRNLKRNIPKTMKEHVKDILGEKTVKYIASKIK